MALLWGSPTPTGPATQLVMEDAVEVWDGLKGMSEGEVLAAVKGDGAKCALAFPGCLQHVIRSALGRVLEQDSAGVVETQTLPHIRPITLGKQRLNG